MMSAPILVALLVLGTVAILLVRMRQGARRIEASNVLPLTGTETGSFEDYLARIEALARTGADQFFVTAAEPDGARFIQVSAAREGRQPLAYQFDIPILPWSQAYVARIEAEAEKRGLRPYRVTSAPMDFLDIDFASSGDHAVFARWVVTEVFGLPRDARFKISWG